MAVPSSPTFTAFLAGTVVPLEQVPDPVFAGRMMGDGLAIEPPADAPQTLRAPCAGTIVQLHASHHACFLRGQAAASASRPSGGGPKKQAKKPACRTFRLKADCTWA